MRYLSIIIEKILPVVLVAGCAGAHNIDMQPFQYREISAGDYVIAAWEHITDPTSPVHIYIEGDGHAFNASGRPTTDPSPRGTTLRKIALRDTNANVVYLARPCQFIMSDKCSVRDWTSGRFAANIIESMAIAVKDVAHNMPIVLIGYSGGAMVSGLVITQHPELNIKKWVTIAGVLNHTDWTEYFGDKPLDKSLDMDVLPHVPQMHYIAENDEIVPFELSKKWVGNNQLIIIPDTMHNDFDSWVFE